MHPHLHTKDNRGVCTHTSFLLGFRNHTDLSTIGCDQVMSALEECHAQGFLHKVLGNCNSAKMEVNKCLRAERLERTVKNREKAKEKKARIQKVWKEIDEES